MTRPVILLMGYPAAGKSTVAKEYEEQGYIILNRDQAGGKVLDLLPRFKTLVGKGRKVLLDNTFPTIQSRKPFVDAAGALNKPIICIWLKSTIEQAQFNACRRLIERFGKLPTPAEIKAANDPNIYPPIVLFKYRKELEPPKKSEGFAEVRTRDFTLTLPPAYKNGAIIFDYDGTLRETKSGAKWPTVPDDVVLLPGRKNISGLLKQDSLWAENLLAASNQSGIAKGEYSEDDARACFDRTNELLGVDIDYLFCPHSVPPISCWCRKPMPGLSVHFIEKYKLDPSKCLVVGDMTTDKTFAQRSGMEFAWAKDFFQK
ncbi:MAG: HAD-IIIA family hydrolase [Promethearchaeota archaeon]|jgi:HAD superfamily hydrolase (TIGR01662 family)